MVDIHLIRQWLLAAPEHPHTYLDDLEGIPSDLRDETDEEFRNRILDIKGYKMTKETALANLASKFGKESWFHSVSPEPEFGKDLVLYAKYLSSDVIYSVPEKIDGFRVILHFASYKEVILSTVIATPAITVPEKSNKQSLTEQLLSLSAECGEESLRNILYEIHTKAKKTSRDSKNYSEIRNKLETLYAEIGFDALYSELMK